MTVAQTSLDCYCKTLADLGDKQAQVLATIERHGPLSDSQIANALGWTINRVTPRRGELQGFYFIRLAGQRRNENNRFENTWEIVR